MALTTLVGIRTGNGGGGLDIGFAIVVRVRILVGEVKDNLVLKFLGSECGSIGAVKNLEAVLKESLADIVNLTKQLDRRPVITIGSLGEGDTHRNVVQSSGLKGERTGGLHETAVHGRITGSNLSPVIGVDSRDNAIGTPVPWVTVIGEHKVAVDFGGVDSRGNGVSAVFHTLIVLPVTTEVVVVIGSFGRLTIDSTATIVIVHKTAHTETLIVNNIVTKVDTIDGAVANDITLFEIPALIVESKEVVGMVGNVDSIVDDTSLSIDRVGTGSLLLHLVTFKELVNGFACGTAKDIVNVNLGIVLAIGIHVGALEEVNTDCRGNTGITTGTGAVAAISIVAVTETTTNVATHKVVKGISQVGINPLAEVSLT